MQVYQRFELYLENSKLVILGLTFDHFGVSNYFFGVAGFFYSTCLSNICHMSMAIWDWRSLTYLVLRNMATFFSSKQTRLILPFAILRSIDGIRRADYPEADYWARWGKRIKKVKQHFYNPTFGHYTCLQSNQCCEITNRSQERTENLFKFFFFASRRFIKKNHHRLLLTRL